MVFCREVVEERDHALVDEASELPFCASCVPLSWVAGKETAIQVRYTCISIALDPAPPSPRQTFPPSQERLKVRKHYSFW